MSYKKECQETFFSLGSVPTRCCLGIQPNCLNVHSRFECSLSQAESLISFPRAKRKYVSSVASVNLIWPLLIASFGPTFW